MRYSALIHATPLRDDAQLTPEEDLLCEIVGAAYFDLASPSARVRADALGWFESHDRLYVFSFEYICDHFGWSSSEMRAVAQGRTFQERQKSVRPSALNTYLPSALNTYLQLQAAR